MEGAGQHVRLHLAITPLAPCGIAPETCSGVKPNVIASMIAVLG